MEQLTAHVVYLIGAPGSGKSSALLNAFNLLGWEESWVATQPFRHQMQGPVLYMGSMDGDFTGTDRLSMSVQPKAVQFIKDNVGEVVVGEGDRLGNGKFLDQCKTLDLIYIDTPINVAYQRMFDRATELGTEPQDFTWWKGRASKAGKLAYGYSDQLTTVDGAGSPQEVAQEVAAVLAATQGQR